MDKAGDHYILWAQCSPTIPFPRCFDTPNPPPHPMHPTLHSPLILMPPPWVRQVTITYCSSMFTAEQASKRSSEIFIEMPQLVLTTSHIHKLKKGHNLPFTWACHTLVTNNY